MSMAHVLAVMTLNEYIALSMKKAYRIRHGSFDSAADPGTCVLAFIIIGGLATVSEAMSARDSA